MAQVKQATKQNSDSKHGTIAQVMGPVIDVEFSEAYLPAIYDALFVKSDVVESGTLTLEVAAHIGEGRVRTIALGPTDGLHRGDAVEASGKPISVPVGKKTLGRIFN